VEIADQCEEKTSPQDDNELQEEIHVSESSSRRRDIGGQFNRRKKTNDSTCTTSTFATDDDDDDIGLLYHQPRVFTPDSCRSKFLMIIKITQVYNCIDLSSIQRLLLLHPPSVPTLNFSPMYGGSDSSKRAQSSADSDSNSADSDNGKLIKSAFFFLEK
jgi:hypothetical protein